jgi:Zn ribbon nucleic-acid-binding protein
MINYHQTASCPNCGKDSYTSTWEAMFVPVKCIHCKCKFKFNPKTGNSEVVNDDKK